MNLIFEFRFHFSAVDFTDDQDLVVSRALKSCGLPFSILGELHDVASRNDVATLVECERCDEEMFPASEEGEITLAQATDDAVLGDDADGATLAPL